MDRFPNLFIAGAPKCGTTSLASWLGQHPDMFVPAMKEPGYFGADLTRSRPRRSLESYLDLYARWADEPHALDASTVSFYSRSAPDEIAVASPRARILIALRDPVEACHSMYHEKVFGGIEPAGTFEEALAAQDTRRADPAPLKSGIREDLIYADVYAYRRNVGRYVARFGRDRVRIVLMDDIRSDPERTVAELCGWIGLSEEPLARIKLTARNAAKRARSTRLGLLVASPPAWAGRLAAPLLSRERRLRMRAAVQRFNAVPVKNPPIRPETRAWLVENFRPEVLWLSDLLDRDLSHWLHADG